MKAWIGLGSNLDQPAERLIQALHAFQRLPGVTLTGHSRLYASAPVGPRDQPDFVNAAASLDTHLSPLALLHSLQALELAAGRVRRRHWGERTLDLDILLIDNRTLSLPSLQVPHPHLTERAFVLIPLREIAPGICLPDGTPLDSFLPAVQDQAIHPLAELNAHDLVENPQRTD
ncbi:7,8-dihydro-6-hydroxymethylpterin-pyrophosphokinase [Alcanivorax hongdengensis A-11-3]|uniref:2-amino-4-hydroxy-6-hydroxymethyldihydropteridine pyrophosphokinase n=1 Tax=Alcanivorax hongdengensis A-11-3 TaxID=1177179 RepID=L0WHN3_9GAMM|nr:2-amino-4-hydroxy-6-hydroxymethyldihydropteridine diphosphokinase [Alcanivorax hongdengensis]EKF75345.1 7,8-dihydro-6-hydroxymethylpterin-pyrophosphokinase [Alcanivorax hongdengensis A-11-3]